MKLEDIARVAKQSSSLSHDKSYIYRKTPNERCVNLIDILYDKIIELMSKDTKKRDIEKMIIIKGAQNLRGPVKKFIMIDMSIDDAKDVLDRAKIEIEYER